MVRQVVRITSDKRTIGVSLAVGQHCNLRLRTAAVNNSRHNSRHICKDEFGLGWVFSIPS